MPLLSLLTHIYPYLFGFLNNCVNHPQHTVTNKIQCCFVFLVFVQIFYQVHTHAGSLSQIRHCQFTEPSSLTLSPPPCSFLSLFILIDPFLFAISQNFHPCLNLLLPFLKVSFVHNSGCDSDLGCYF